VVQHVVTFVAHSGTGTVVLSRRSFVLPVCTSLSQPLSQNQNQQKNQKIKSTTQRTLSQLVKRLRDFLGNALKPCGAFRLGALTSRWQ
jgi:hypothetical protein